MEPISLAVWMFKLMKKMIMISRQKEANKCDLFIIYKYIFS
jgi:hypothetical protein